MQKFCPHQRQSSTSCENGGTCLIDTGLDECLTHYGGVWRGWDKGAGFHPNILPMAPGAQEPEIRSYLIATVLTNELGGHVCREHILQEQPGQVLHCLCLFPLLSELFLPQEVQAAVILILGRVSRGP